MASVTVAQAEIDWGVAYAQVSRLRTAIANERKNGNQAGVDALMPLYRDWIKKLNAAGVVLGKPEMNLSTLERAILGGGTYLEQAADALPDAVAKIPGALGAGLFKGALPFIALAGVWLYFRGKI